MENLALELLFLPNISSSQKTSKYMQSSLPAFPLPLSLSVVIWVRLTRRESRVKWCESAMTRRCSHCSNNGHNSRTCPSRGGVKLFGVRLTDGSSIKKSASMGNLSSAHHHSPSSPSLNPGSPHDPFREAIHETEGYLSDDPNHASCSSNRRNDRKKGIFFIASNLFFVFAYWFVLFRFIIDVLIFVNMFLFFCLFLFNIRCFFFLLGLLKCTLIWVRLLLLCG